MWKRLKINPKKRLRISQNNTLIVGSERSECYCGNIHFF